MQQKITKLTNAYKKGIITETEYLRRLEELKSK